MPSRDGIWIVICVLLALGSLVPYWRKHRKHYPQSQPASGILINRLAETAALIYSLKIVLVTFLVVCNVAPFQDVRQRIGIDAMLYLLLGIFALDYTVFARQKKGYDLLGSTPTEPVTQNG